MKYFFFLILGFLFSYSSAIAARMEIGVSPSNSLTGGVTTSWGLVEVLSFIEEILLKVALPLVIIGTGLYVAYQLFLAEGNEEKMKKAWKSVTFGSIGVICIAMGYAIISLTSRLSI